MMRLIDAEALKAYIDAQKGRPFIGCTVGEALKIMTDEQPTIDAVLVTRCKDCVHAFPADTPRTCTRSEMRIKAYGFCAWATKRRNTDDK